MSEIRQLRTLAIGLPHGTVVPPHDHAWDQLVYASAGVMTVRTSRGSWVVPPQRAVWVPAGIEHDVRATGFVSMRTLYLPAGAITGLPRRGCVVDVPPLLRELILHAVALGVVEDPALIRVIVDCVRALPEEPLHLPLPRDPRARTVAERLLREPSDRRPLRALCRGASARTVERLFRAETDLSFGQWRKQLRLLQALPLLAAGRTVTQVALDVGYESTSAFVAMFRQALGVTPGRYYRRVRPGVTSTTPPPSAPARPVTARFRNSSA